MKNELMFEAVKKLNLPPGQYIITGSGALGIRNLREIGDIDILVTEELWELLVSEFGETDADGTKKVVFPGGIVEAFHASSFYNETRESHAPTVAERIAQADIIDGLPFESFDHVIYYKRKMGREKDRRDIAIIEEFLKK